MTTGQHDTTPAQAAAAAPVEAPLLTHLVCCRKNTGICGTVTDGIDMPYTAAVTCSTCDAIDEDGAPCGAWFCRIRQWFRGHFGRPQ